MHPACSTSNSPSEVSLLHTQPTNDPSLVKSAAGTCSTLSNNHIVLDACGVASIGHGDETVKFAIQEQLKSVAYAHPIMHTTTAPKELADILLRGTAPQGLSKAYFVSSGSDAIEAAMKLVVAFHRATGNPHRTHFVSRKRSYHGNTIGAMCLSDNPGRKMPYEEAFDRLDVSFVSPAYAYRYKGSDETEIQYAARLVNEVEAEFCRIGRQNVAAFVAETVGGSTAGCIEAPRGYFEGVRRVCDKYGALLLLDETMCGNGRTGSYFAFETEGAVHPDIVVMGKGLSGGYLPLAATLINKKIHETVEMAGGFIHGHAYQAHPVSCASALAVQRVIRSKGFLDHCRRQGDRLGTELRATFAGLEFVGDIRGRGLFWAIEFVADKRLKIPLAKEFAFGTRLRQFAHDSGVAILSGSGTADGLAGDHILLAPPLTITEAELDWMIGALRQAYLRTEEAYKKQRTFQ
ncbi:aminotransferase class-III [Cordyceps javanica]|uniref:Aminotransferase class-III n=1 Tax=Cordyceps javanica TaxID=43265 RepID=A0A545UKK0_9HYPO|nr:aminotransferase class-III [Cordyceps javanica]TQV90180.1 aminotransferase class-III [Cordyceps javanica]